MNFNDDDITGCFITLLLIIFAVGIAVLITTLFL